jgi:hypothetical protein
MLSLGVGGGEPKAAPAAVVHAIDRRAAATIFLADTTD